VGDDVGELCEFYVVEGANTFQMAALYRRHISPISSDALTCGAESPTVPRQ
jgi:hypothetical protein